MSQRLTGQATTKVPASDIARLAQNRGSSSLAPGIASTMALSMISMTTMDTVSADSAMRTAREKAIPPARSGRIVKP